jgi:hypothetical protein
MKSGIKGYKHNVQQKFQFTLQILNHVQSFPDYQKWDVTDLPPLEESRPKIP